MAIAVDAENEAPSGSFAQRLKELRRQRNLSQVDLARLAGLHSTHISRFERDISHPGAASLKRLADALGVPSDYPIEGSPDQAARSRLDDRKLLRLFQQVAELPDEDKVVVKRFLDAFLFKQQLQAQLAARSG